MYSIECIVATPTKDPDVTCSSKGGSSLGVACYLQVCRAGNQVSIASCGWDKCCSIVVYHWIIAYNGNKPPAWGFLLLDFHKKVTAPHHTAYFFFIYRDQAKSRLSGAAEGGNGYHWLAWSWCFGRLKWGLHLLFPMGLQHIAVTLFLFVYPFSLDLL